MDQPSPRVPARTVWDDAKRSLFIESLLLNVPIPPIFLYEWDLSRYEVMDGQQRLNAIVDFYENGFALKRLERWSLINGYRYSELPETLKRGLDRRRISATVLLVGGGEDGEKQPEKSDIRKLVFDRLNTGGQPLNGQELRNCLFAGNFNDLVTNTLSADPVFTAIWGPTSGPSLHVSTFRSSIVSARYNPCDFGGTKLEASPYPRAMTVRHSVPSPSEFTPKRFRAFHG